MTQRKTLTLMTGLALFAMPLAADEEDPGPLTEAQEQAESEPQEAAAVSEDPPVVVAQEEGEAEGPSEQQLRQQMRQLQHQLNQAREQLRENQNQPQVDPQAASRELIENTVLPDEPTREESEEYVATLRQAAEGRRSFSSGDPLVEKLRAIPPHDADLLITEMANQTSLRYYANYAMRGVDPSALRERFVEMLDENPNMIGVIVMYGWVEDARDTITQRIQTADATLTPAWFQAAVELNEPALYDKLHEVTIGSRYASHFLNMLATLPDYDLEHTVQVCWERASANQAPISEYTIAPFAARYGIVDALGVLIQQLGTNTNYMASASSFNQRRTNVLRLIEFRGSNSEIIEWFNENREQLVFDHLHGRFVLPEAF